MRANGYAGRLEPAQLAYVALTSRLLEGRPINLALMGDPAAGKNATIDAALALIPRKGVYEFTASSPTALVYTDEDFQHRVVIFDRRSMITSIKQSMSTIYFMRRSAGAS
jgi:GTPase involved in cell partitioning and DNA repair